MSRRVVSDRLLKNREAHLALLSQRGPAPVPVSTLGLEQACPECGIWEAAGYHCSWCFFAIGPEGWYPWGSNTARRAAARASAAEKAQTPPKRPRGRPRRSEVNSKPNVAASRHLGRHGRGSAGSRRQESRRTLFHWADRALKRGDLE